LKKIKINKPPSFKLKTTISSKNNSEALNKTKSGQVFLEPPAAEQHGTGNKSSVAAKPMETTGAIPVITANRTFFLKTT